MSDGLAYFEHCDADLSVGRLTKIYCVHPLPSDRYILQWQVEIT